MKIEGAYHRRSIPRVVKRRLRGASMMPIFEARHRACVDIYIYIYVSSCTRLALLLLLTTLNYVCVYVYMYVCMYVCTHLPFPFLKMSTILITTHDTVQESRLTSDSQRWVRNVRTHMPWRPSAMDNPHLLISRTPGVVARAPFLARRPCPSVLSAKLKTFQIVRLPEPMFV